jgi:hypothetical protein
MTVCIHQPDFVPWLGFFDRLIKADVFVILDDVQFLRRGWQNRNRIKTPDGWRWLTVPVKQKGKFSQPINQVVLANDTPWRRKHLGALVSGYSGAPNFDQIYPEILKVYDKNDFLLIDFNMSLIKLVLDILNIDIPIRFASEFNFATRKSHLLVDLVRALDGDTYLSGQGARSYMDEKLFLEHGIETRWQEFKHPQYNQLHGEFIPDLSIMDVLFNCGSGARKLLSA